MVGLCVVPVVDQPSPELVRGKVRFRPGELRSLEALNGIVLAAESNVARLSVYHRLFSVKPAHGQLDERALGDLEILGQKIGMGREVFRERTLS